MRYTSSQSGFSLVETLVAITILLLVIIGPMKISSQTARSSSFASEQVTAFFLAQEGMELAEKARDDFLIPSFASANPDPWADFKNTSGTLRRCYNANGCKLEINQDGTVNAYATDEDCGAITDANCLLYTTSAAGSVRSRFTYSDAPGNVPTIYTRRVKFSVQNADEVRIISEVTWRTGFIKDQQSVIVESALFNIYGKQ